jgi:hypothetical protein
MKFWNVPVPVVPLLIKVWIMHFKINSNMIIILRPRAPSFDITRFRNLYYPLFHPPTLRLKIQKKNPLPVIFPKIWYEMWINFYFIRKNRQKSLAYMMDFFKFNYTQNRRLWRLRLDLTCKTTLRLSLTY